MRRPLEGKVALITGASGGIGAMIARGLGIAGASLALTGLTPKRVTRVVEGLQAGGFPEDQVFGIAADLSDPEPGAKVVAATLAKYGKIDILINAAGVGRFDRFDAMSLETVMDVIGSNLMATIYTTHHALPALLGSGGHIINLSSGLGKKGAAKASAFAAAKFGVQGFSESLRLDVAGRGVRVSVISPAGAGVDTGFWDQAGLKVKREGMLLPERVAEVVLVILTTRGKALLDDVTIRTA